MSQNDRQDEISALAGQLRTHLEFLSELGIESAGEFVGVAKLPMAAAKSPLRESSLPGRDPAALRPAIAPRMAPKAPAPAGLADLPRLGAPRTAGRAVAPGAREKSSANRGQTTLTTKPLIEIFTNTTSVAGLPASEEGLPAIQAAIGDCTRCPLHEGRTHIVHTEGDPNARLMFVGEAPGADEDAQARPFVGRAGQLLGKIIEAIGFRRDEVLIGNINRCRPPGNRPPTPDEVAACKPFLLRELGAIRPDVVVVLGNTAMKNLLGVKEGITKLRGTFQDFHGIKVMPTFHPAYLLRDPSKKRETWADLKKVRDFLLENQS